MNYISTWMLWFHIRKSVSPQNIVYLLMVIWDQNVLCQFYQNGPQWRFHNCIVRGLFRYTLSNILSWIPKVFHAKRADPSLTSTCSSYLLPPPLLPVSVSHWHRVHVKLIVGQSHSSMSFVMQPHFGELVEHHCRKVYLGPRYKKPGLQAEKNWAHHKYKQYSDDGLSGYTVSSLTAVRHRYILFVFMVSLVFFFPPAVRA